ncbi:MAG TPA: TonB-dependent receptor [Chitinophagaceae bacterium]
MKVTVLILLACLQVSARGRAQLITMSEKNASLEKVFKDIRKQTGYYFLYNDEMLQEAKRVTMNVQNVSLAQVLEIAFKDQPLSYTIEANTIVIKKKSNTVVVIEPIQDNNANNKNNIPIKGVVRDENGQVLEGATVSIKGSGLATKTNEKGEFSIEVPNENAVLVISYVGYEPKEVKAQAQKKITISLAFVKEQLSDIVVIGYGTARKRDLTTSISTLSSEDVMKTPTTAIEQALQGNAAGVLVTNTSAEPGGDITIRVRGGSSIKADNEPLLVIDGFTSDQGLSSLNPADIKSIEILKDAGATAIYGSRGANGVVLVTTKSGAKGKPIVTYENYYGVQSLRRKLPLLNAAELAQLANEAREAIGSSPNTLRPDTIPTNRDWQDLLFHTASQYSSTISISGGDDKVKYYISANYLKQQGLIINSDYSKASLRGNLDFNLNKAISAGVKLNLSQTLKHGIQVGDNGSVLRANATNPTDKGLLDPSGSFYVDPVTGDPVSTSPLANAQETTNEKKNMSVMVGGYLQIKFLKHFAIRSNATMSPSYGLNNYYFPNTIRGDKVSDAYEQMLRYSKWSNDNTISYTNKIKRHSFSILAGQEVTKSFNNNFKAEGTDFSTDVFTFYNLNSGNGAPLISSAASEYKLLSFFGRTTYNFSDRYLLSFTYRADGSSKFGVNNKWGYFPAGSIAWRLSNERFLKKFKAVNDIKIRASYGVNGSDRIDPYSSLSIYSTRATAIGGALGTGYMINRMANSDLKWEKTKELDLGVDFSILKGRISFTADYYEKNTNDLLLDYSLPAASGYTTVVKNVGSVENKGWEVSVTSKNITGKDFRWTTSFNAALNRNKVTNLGGASEISAISNSSSNTKFGNVVLIKVGQPLGVFYGYQTNGIFQTQAEINATTAKLEGSKTLPGFIKYVDQNKDGIINEQDKVILGNPMPDWNGGMTNNFSYKNFDFSVFMIFQQGNSILNTSYTKLMNYTGSDNQLAKVLNRWRPPNPLTGDPGNPSNTIPRAYSNGYTGAMSDMYVEDGSYLRIKTLSLAYSLNNKSIKGLKLPSLRFYVTATNLFTFTKYYGGYDPEVSYMGKQSVGAGIDNGSYPTSKMFVFGINATF